MFRMIFTLTFCLSCILLAGCDRSPSNLGPEYHKGKCVVCKRKTMVRDTIMNPINNYKAMICWRVECGKQFQANPNKFVDKSKMATPEEMQQFLSRLGVPGANGNPAPAKKP